MPTRAGGKSCFEGYPLQLPERRAKRSAKVRFPPIADAWDLGRNRLGYLDQDFEVGDIQV